MLHSQYYSFKMFYHQAVKKWSRLFTLLKMVQLGNTLLERKSE